MNEWLQRSYKYIGKYFKASSIKEFYENLKDISYGIIHVHSMYSVADSTQSTDEICERVKELGGSSVTLTDHGTMLGIERFMKSGAKYNINTIPGVESYITMDSDVAKKILNIKDSEEKIQTRNHMVFFARNYKGYVDISHALREANTNIVEVKGTKLENAIMTKEMCEEFFKGNEDIVATTACIQGIVGNILLTNKRLERKTKKEKEKVADLENDFDIFNEKSPLLNEKKKELSSTKKIRKSFDKYVSDTYMRKIEKLKNDLENMSDDNPKYKKILSNYEEAIGQNEEAKKNIVFYDNIISDLESQLAILKKEVDSVKKNADKYKKALEKLNVNSYLDDNELYEMAKGELLWFKNTFPLGFVELQYHGLADEEYVMPILVKLARELDIPLIAANDAHMKDNSDESIEARRIVRYNYFNKAQTIDDADKELYIKSVNELAEWLMKVVDKDACYEALFNTKILETCKVVFPNEEHYPSVNSDVDFMEMVLKGKDKRIKEGVIEKWTDEYQKRLEHEVKTMTDMGYVDYHKVVEDFCREGRLLGSIPKCEIINIPSNYEDVHKWIEESHFPKGIGVGPGRGSGVGSLVCCCLGITNLDPIKYNLLFERFLNPERISMPDIDTDIATRLRPTMIKYLKWKYGERAVCSIATETTYAAKGAIQMAGRDRASQKYLSLPKKEYDLYTRKYLYDYTSKLSSAIPEELNITLDSCEDSLKSIIESDEEFKLIWNRAKLIEGKLQGTSIHAGGVIISDNDNVNDYIPLAYNKEKDVWAAQCDMITAEEKGLLKMDLLGLSTLDCESECIYLVYKYKGVEIDINKIEFEPEVFKHIYSKGNTNSVFQFESAGMKDMLKKFKPTCFEDIILLVACYRPGPMQYLEDIIKIKNGEKELTYKHPMLEDILSSTYGAVVYQEQVMQIFQKLAGYSLGGADLVRRAMSKKKESVLEKEREAFVNGDKSRNIEGCVARGVKAEIANELFNEIMDFAKYAFNKSHAAAYACVSYQTAWLKYHYPTEYLCAMFNNKAQDSFAPLIEDCNLYNIKLLPPDINKSSYDFIIEDENIRYGIGGVKGIGEANTTSINFICKNRNDKMYDSIEDFMERNREHITNKMVNIFIDSGMFDNLGYNREACSVTDEEIKLVKGDTSLSYKIEKEVELLGTIISIDPLKDYQEEKKYQCIPISELEDNSTNSIMGFVTSIEKKNNKFGDLVYVMEVRGKSDKIFVHTNKYLTFKYKPNDLLYKVLKFSGNVKYGRMFANKITIPNPELYEYYIDLDTKEKTNTVTEIINSETDNEGDVCIRICCHWVLRNGILTQTDRPKVAERWISYDGLNKLSTKGIQLNKWISR